MFYSLIYCLKRPFEQWLKIVLLRCTLEKLIVQKWPIYKIFVFVCVSPSPIWASYTEIKRRATIAIKTTLHLRPNDVEVDNHRPSTTNKTHTALLAIKGLEMTNVPTRKLTARFMYKTPRFLSGCCSQGRY